MNSLAPRHRHTFATCQKINRQPRGETENEGRMASVQIADHHVRIAVIGATGRIGRHVCGLALAHGHEVVALARHPERIPAAANLTKARVDLGEASVTALAPLLRGIDLVISCIGNRRHDGEPQVVALGTAIILAAMAMAEVPRLVMVSSLGIGDSWRQLLGLGWVGWMASYFFATAMREDREDLATAEALAIGAPSIWPWGEPVPHSRPKGISVVVVRPAGLTNDPRSHAHQCCRADEALQNGFVAREDVARFMVSLVSQERFDRWRDGPVSIGAAIERRDGPVSIGAATARADAKALSKPLGELDA